MPPPPFHQGDGHQCEGSSKSDHAGSPTPGEDSGEEAADIVIVAIVQRGVVMVEIVQGGDVMMVLVQRGNVMVVIVQRGDVMVVICSSER